MSLPAEFRLAISNAHAALAAMDPARARQSFRVGGWLRVELLGHMIDSCLYNHVRFLTAATARSLNVARYDQDNSVQLHGYAALDWEEVLDYWCIHTELLTRLVERIPEEAYAVECRLEDGGTMRLDELIRDYIRHVEHHVAQLA
jgi:hypothetical protein